MEGMKQKAGRRKKGFTAEELNSDEKLAKEMGMSVSTIVVPYDGHRASLNTVRPGHGTIRTVQYEPDNEAELTRIIMVEHRHQTGKIKKAPKPGRSHPVR